MRKIIIEGYSRLLNFAEDYKYPLIIFLISRLIVLLTYYLTSLYGLGVKLIQWDANSYISIATNGYIFNGEYKGIGSLIGFFHFIPPWLNYFLF